MNLIDEVRDIRRASTPIVLVDCVDDYRKATAEIASFRMSDENKIAIYHWDIVRGHYGYDSFSNQALAALGEATETVRAPAAFLNKLIENDNTPENSMVFFYVPDQEILNEPTVIQSIANVRDEFKSSRRTLFIMGRGLIMPALLRQDVPVLIHELPDVEKIKTVIEKVYNDANQKPKDGEIEKAAELCRGMSSFAVEEGCTRKIRKAGMDFESLGRIQQASIEAASNQALLFEKEKWTFDDIGGLTNLKNFFEMLFKGPRPPSLIVRWDELDKSISAASTGTVADNTGTSQDQLRVLLTSMEENGWLGSFLIGSPGVGKSLASICTGNTFGARVMAGDLGAMKESLVGASEQRIRDCMGILKSIGGSNVLFLATANRIDTIPPELMARFSLGTWFIDTPDRKEKEAIWKIQMKKFNIKEQKIPNDDHWVGRDIRNCCRQAYLLDCTLLAASNMISISGKASLKDIIKLRELAEQSCFLSANKPGTYTRSQSNEGKGRKFNVQDN